MGSPSRVHNISSDWSISGFTNGAFSQRLLIPRNHNRVSLVSAQIPKTYYLIQSGKNTFQLDSTTYTIPIGNYQIRDFISQINTLVTPSVFAYNTKTSKISLTSSASSITVSSQRLRKIFGLTSTVTAISGSVTFPSICCMAATGQIWICTNLVTNDGTGVVVGNALSHFFCNSQSDLSYVIYDNPYPPLSSRPLAFVQPGDGQGDMAVDVQFFILDDTEERLDLNGLGVDFVIVTYYEEPSLYPLIQQLGSTWVNLKQEERMYRQQQDQLQSR